MYEFLHKMQDCQWALTLIRIFLGIVFFAHGSQKVLGWFGGHGLQPFVSWLGTLGVPAVLGYAAAFFEFVGACLLLLGAASELGAFMVGCSMIGAIYLVHADKGFFVTNSGYEYALTLLILSLAIIIGGPGKLALWRL